MRKGNKANFAKVLKEAMGPSWKELNELPPCDSTSYLLVDMRGLINRYQSLGARTFQGPGHAYLRMIVKFGSQDNCHIIHVIGDRYDLALDKSLKLEERYRRESGKPSTKSTVHVCKPESDVPLPNFDVVLGRQENKQHLLRYLQENWMIATDLVPEGFLVTVGGFSPGPAVMISQKGTKTVEALDCNSHEEADSRLFAHAKYATTEQHCKRVIVLANDTDVFMLAVYHSTQICGLDEMLIKRPKCKSSNDPARSRDSYLPCHEVAEFLINNYSPAAPGTILTIYALTGCDTVSYPYGCGKKHAFVVAFDCLAECEVLGAFGKIGQTNEVTTEVTLAARKFF